MELAFTDRWGGASSGSTAALNLADTGPEPVALREQNWRLLLADFAPQARLARMSQVHGNAVAEAVVDQAPVCDGLVTTQPEVVLAVRTADCVPVLLADPSAGVIGVAHAGREGVVQQVVVTTVERMREKGAQQLHAWVGPHVCGRCYEVPAAMADAVIAVEPAAHSRSWSDTPSLDLGAAVQAQLQRVGVGVTAVQACTKETPDLYSYRRDGSASGRQAGILYLRSGQPPGQPPYHEA